MNSPPNLCPWCVVSPRVTSTASPQKSSRCSRQQHARTVGREPGLINIARVFARPMNSGPPLGREGGVADFPNKLGLKKTRLVPAYHAKKTKHPPDTLPVSFTMVSSTPVSSLSFSFFRLFVPSSAATSDHGSEQVYRPADMCDIKY